MLTIQLLKVRQVNQVIHIMQVVEVMQVMKVVNIIIIITSFLRRPSAVAKLGLPGWLFTKLFSLSGSTLTI